MEPLEEEQKRKLEEEERRKELERKKKEEEQKRKEEEQKRIEEQRKKEEAAREKAAEELRRKQQWQELDDSAELESFKPDADCLYTNLDEKVYIAYAKLAAFTRELNTERAWQVPEILLLGNEGEGRTSVLEIILGHAVASGRILRPVLINMVNNLECEEPRVTFKRDSLFPDLGADIPVPLSQIPVEVGKRNKASDDPIHIRYEYKYCWNVIFIDTPGLLQPGQEGELERENIVMELAKPQDRILLFVEESKEWEKSQMLQLAEKIDSKLRRSIFVYCKLYYQLVNFSNVRDLNLYFSGRPPAKVKSFFLSLFSSKTHDLDLDPKKFRTRVEQSQKRDFELLDKLKYDKKHEGIVGAQALRKHLSELIFKKYNDCIPDLLKQVRTLKKSRTDTLLALQQQIRTLDNNKLRSIASNYVSEFLQYLVALLQGSLEGNPTLNGQSLEEEKTIAGEWTGPIGTTILFDPQDWKIPNHETKLYGGQQFERLLAEFKAVADSSVLKSLSMDDIATAAGLSGLKSVPTHIWAASDLAQRKCNQVFKPLITQLVHRALFIILRLFEIVETIMEIKKKRTTHYPSKDFTDLSLSITKDFPQFVWYVKDLYEDTVATTAKECIAKCMDELYCTRLIYWEQTSKKHIDKIVRNSKKNDDLKQNKKSVEALASDIFQDQLKRITKNIMLKTYDNFLVKMSKSVSGDIQGKVACMTDDQMSEMFDLNATLERLKERETEVQKMVEFDTELAFMESASKFRI